jgi:hypothetical protein
MKYSQSKLESIVELNIGEWSRRSRSESLLSKEKGFFVWNDETDWPLNCNGIFYTYNMIPNHFEGQTVSKLQKKIQEANHEAEIVVALFFEDRGMVARLTKIKNCEETEE